MTNLVVSVELKLRNMLATAMGPAVKDFGRQNEKLHRDAANAGIQNATRFNRAYEALGIRSNRAIEREIARTEAAYNRLRRSGTLSMQEQARAAEAARGRVRELREEMGKISRMDRAVSLGRGAVALAAGAAAARYVIQPKVEQAMSYDLRLAHMSNTAFTDRDLAGRKTGMTELSQSVTAALQHGGGKRDDAASALDEMIASGTIPVAAAKSMLKDIMLSATATGSGALDFSGIAVRGMQNMGATDANIGRFFNIATSAGQQGGFEIRDMARWLPAQMALAGTLGMRGETGFAKLAAMNQAAVMAAGTKDEAGNNVRNLLTKINSKDTAQDAAKLGIDMPAYLAMNKERGVDAVDAFANLIRKEVQNDPLFKQISAKAAASGNDDEKRALYEQMAGIVSGKGAGSLIQDQQAMMALVPLLANPQYVKDVERKALADTNAIGRNAELIKETASFKTEALGNEKQFAEQALFEKLAPAITGVADGMTGMARAYPGLTTATVGATIALTALAAAAGAAGLANMLTGGGLGKANVAMGAAKATMGAAAGVAGRAGLVGLAGAGGYAVGTGISKVIEGTAVADAIGSAIARTLAFFGNKEAQEAVRINDSLTKSQEAPKATLEGTLKIVVDDEGRVRAVKVAKPFGPGVNIDTGYVMGAS